MHFRSGERAFRLCEAVRVRIGPDVVLTFCNAQAKAACPRGTSSPPPRRARTPVQTECPCFLYHQDVSNGTPTLMNKEARARSSSARAPSSSFAPLWGRLASPLFLPSVTGRGMGACLGHDAKRAALGRRLAGVSAQLRHGRQGGREDEPTGLQARGPVGLFLEATARPHPLGRAPHDQAQLLERLDRRLGRLEPEVQLLRLEWPLGKLAPALHLQLPLRVALPDPDRSGATPRISAVSLREWPCACKKAAWRARAEKLRRDVCAR